MCLPTKSILQIAVSAAASSAIQLNTEKRDDVTIGNDRTFSEGWRSISPPMYLVPYDSRIVYNNPLTKLLLGLLSAAVVELEVQ